MPLWAGQEFASPTSRDAEEAHIRWRSDDQRRFPGSPRLHFVDGSDDWGSRRGLFFLATNEIA